MDNVDRLVDADEGTLTVARARSRTRRQTWTLTRRATGTTTVSTLNGDGTAAMPTRLDDTRTHNDVNELGTRDIDTIAAPTSRSPTTLPGNLIDDARDYELRVGRLLPAAKGEGRRNGQALFAEYRYNGLGYRIAVHEDTDTDGDVDSNDKWYYDAFDERWRQVARFRESDASPKEEFIITSRGTTVQEPQLHPT